MSYQTELRQRITDRIVAALKEGCPPWRKPWGTGTILPTNAVSNRRYSGVNLMLLDLIALERGFTSSLWATYQQWASIGCQVKRRPAGAPQGQWGATVVFCKPVTKVRKNDDGDEEKDKFFVLKEYTVFNLNQVEGPGLERFRVAQPGNASFVDYAPADEAIKATKADIRYGGGKAFYRRGDDFIQIPHKETFHDIHEWYATHFHELAHWAECRVGWKGSYALGELIAEIASCYLATELGVPQSDDLTNHHAYLASWLKELSDDHGAIFRAAKCASAVSDFILAFSRPDHGEEDAVEGAMAGACMGE